MDVPFEWTDCVVCGGANFDLVLKKTYYGAALRGVKKFDYTIVRCSQCGLVFVNPRISISNLRMLYGLYPDLRVVVDVFPPEKAFFGLARRKYLSLYLDPLREGTDGIRVLDVLCRDGSFLEEVRKALPGAEVHGFEFRPPFIERARKRGLNIRVGSYIDAIQEARYPGEYFDAVFVRHVLEHFYNPGAAVFEFSRILKDNGLLIVEVPNLASINRILFGKEWIVFSSPRQLFHFSPETISLLLTRYNLRVEGVRHPWLHYQLFDVCLAKLLVRPVLKVLARSGGGGNFLNSLRVARVTLSMFPLDPFSLVSALVSLAGAAVGRSDVVVVYARKNATRTLGASDSAGATW